MKTLEAGGGILYRSSNGSVQILLIKRNDTWDLPKGKKEPGEDLMDCAAREVSEEVGVSVFKITGYLCETYHEYHENGDLIGKTTAWYAMLCDNNCNGLTPQKEEGITELQWTGVGEGLEKVGYENLRKVITTFKVNVLK